MIRVKFWGVRGSIPCPGPYTTRYGGNTPCIQIKPGGQDIIILEAGTGIHPLGHHLINSRTKLPIHILLTHTHWDHIQGIPFFAPMFSKGYKISFYGPRVSGNSLSRLIMNQLDRCYFPGERGLMAKVRFKELGPERFRIGNLEIRTFGVNHTITSLAYRIQKAKSSIGYTGDNEPPNQVDSGYTGRLVDFFQGCDLLIAEAQYTDREYRKRVGWGHSSLSHAIELATASKVQRLVIFHYDCSYTDTLLDRLQARLRDQALRKGLFLGVFMAREGMELVI